MMTYVLYVVLVLKLESTYSLIVMFLKRFGVKFFKLLVEIGGLGDGEEKFHGFVEELAERMWHAELVE